MDDEHTYLVGGFESIAERDQLLLRATTRAFVGRVSAIGSAFGRGVGFRVGIVYDRFVLFSRQPVSGGSLQDDRRPSSRVAAVHIRSRQQEAGRERL